MPIFWTIGKSFSAAFWANSRIVIRYKPAANVEVPEDYLPATSGPGAGSDNALYSCLSVW